MDLEAKRDEALKYLEHLRVESSKLAIELERTVGRISTLNELIVEQEASEAQES